MEERLHECVILYARRGLDAAGNIDAVRTDQADRGGDVVGSQPACQQERPLPRVDRQQRPVEVPPGAAATLVVPGIEEEPLGGRMRRCVGQYVADVQSLD